MFFFYVGHFEGVFLCCLVETVRRLHQLNIFRLNLHYYFFDYFDITNYTPFSKDQYSHALSICFLFPPLASVPQMPHHQRSSKMPNADTAPDTPPRMWICAKCSYAYNPIWVDICDICESNRGPAAIINTAIAVSGKDDKIVPAKMAAVRAAALAMNNVDDKSSVTISKNGAVKFSASKSTHDFDEVAAIVDVPMASFEQDLEDDVMFVGDTTPDIGGIDTTATDWTCKKCTLVNSVHNKVCIVCGGSKLKSISSVEDMTLRKGEFWSCAQCTLKNSLSTNTCIACKTTRQVPIISGQQTNFRPYTSTPVTKQATPTAAPYHHNRHVTAGGASAVSTSSSAQGTGSTGGVGGHSSGGLAPPVHRVCRSPSPNKPASGAIPKVKLIYYIYDTMIRYSVARTCMCVTLIHNHLKLRDFFVFAETQHWRSYCGPLGKRIQSPQYTCSGGEDMALPGVHV